MGNNDLSNLGEEIKNIVQDAVGSMDFHKLNKDISDTINSAMKEVKKTVQDGMSGYVGGHEAVSLQKQQAQGIKQEAQKPNKKTSTVIRDKNGRFRKVSMDMSQNAVVRRIQENTQKDLPAKSSQFKKPLVASRPAGKVTRVVFGVLGGIGTFSFGIAYLGIIGSVITSYMSDDAFMALLILFPFLFISVWMLMKSREISKRLNRYYQYVSCLHGRTYCTLKELASQIGKSERFVVKDVRKMIELRMFPYGRIDPQEKYLILNHETYVQYMEAQRMMEQKRIEERNRIEENRREQNRRQVIQEPEEYEEDPLLQQVKEALIKKEEYIKQIRTANDEIQGVEISEKLNVLEAVISKIFEHLEEHPEKLPEMRKFMDYYLPTTAKLVNVYCEFEKQPVQGNKIIAAKKEIEHTVDPLNQAFIKLFDNLFADVVMDVSTDISVLETMLKQEGLTKSDFE